MHQFQTLTPNAHDLLTTVIVLVGPVHRVAGHAVVNLTAYRVAFLTAAAICLAALAWSLSIHDADAAATIPAPASAREAPAPDPPRTQLGLQPPQ